MTTFATVVLAGDDAPGGAPGDAVGRADTGFVGALVERLHAEFGVERQDIRRLATEVLETFATARITVFVPILVEKRLRATYRAWPAGTGPRTE